MDKSKIAEVVKKFIEKTLNNAKTSKPGVSYIINRILKLPALKLLVTNNFTPKEIVELAYIVFYLFEGYSFTEADWKSKNEVYLVVLNEVGDSYSREVSCDDCYGNGHLECEECDGEGEMDCDECEGTGTTTSDADDSNEDCGGCDGFSRRSCGNCEGEAQIECQSCEGRGEVVDEDESIFFNKVVWFIGDQNMKETLSDMKSELGEDYTDKVYDLFDTSKGSVFLSINISEWDFEDLFSFGQENGYDIEGHTRIESIIPIENTEPKTYKIEDDNIRYRLI